VGGKLHSETTDDPSQQAACVDAAKPFLLNRISDLALCFASIRTFPYNDWLVFDRAYAVALSTFASPASSDLPADTVAQLVVRSAKPPIPKGRAAIQPTERQPLSTAKG
jgi:hypothetical protein